LNLIIMGFSSGISQPMVPWAVKYLHHPPP
jgi:hypothetical protein